MPSIGVLVAGHVGIDRIWRLDRALRPGARLRCLARFERVGGGAANTAAALAELGHAPAIAATIGRDAAGDRLAAVLAKHGFDLGAIRRTAATRTGDILLTPDGERTLIGRGGGPAALPEALESSVAEAVYVNFSALAEPARLARLLDRPWLVAQLPLDRGEPRPAHVLIASRSDIGDLPADLLWQRRRALDPALRLLVVTDGPAGAAVVTAGGVCHLPCPAPAVPGDSIGAGDFFAAGLLDALLAGAAPEPAVQHAHQVAARCLERRPAVLDILDGVTVGTHMP